jgi:ribosomal protein S18 acetylase RimI-like enzyme
MNDTIKFLVNHATEKELTKHLIDCDYSFIPRLSERVIIGNYSHKLIENAICFEAWHSELMIGLVAAYCNDQKKQSAFITNISVLPQHQGCGIGTKLMNRCIDHVSQLGYARIELEVDYRNTTAITFYERKGFVTSLNDNLSMKMYIKLRK